MEICKKLIQAAKDSGADCVKFQSWSKDTLFATDFLVQEVDNTKHYMKLSHVSQSRCT